jgi:aspartate carbamoyltransferase catalytic subunit
VDHDGRRRLDVFDELLTLKKNITLPKCQLYVADGPGQHPTQALLDVYTIYNELGRLDNIKVGLVGDLANGGALHVESS